MSYGQPLEIPLHSVTAVKGNKIIFSSHNIQTCRSQFFYSDLSASGIYDPKASGDDIEFRKHPVKEHCLHSRGPVCKEYFQRLGLMTFGINCRKPFQGVFALFDGMAFVSEIAGKGTVCIPDNACRRPVIPGPQGRELLGKGIHRVGFVSARLVGIAGKSAVIIGQQVIHAAFGAFSIVQVEQKSVPVHLHLIRRVFCVQ